MAFSATVQEKVTASGNVVVGTNSYSGDGRESRTIAVPDSTTDLLVNLEVDVSQIQVIVMMSDQALTVETNSSSAPTDTISLLANKPWIWHPNSYDANLLTTDVTALYLTNSSGSAATFELELIHDATP
jgi:hypothetical protein